MNILTIKSRHKGLISAPISKFNTIIDSSSIEMSSKNDELKIVIATRKKETAALSLFFEIYSLVFIYLGAFPTIESIDFNGNSIDTSQWVGKYKTRPDLFRQDLFISNLSNMTINQSAIDGYRHKQAAAIFSLQYLASDDYIHVISDHRITLLFHIIDGICDFDKNKIDILLSEIIQQYKLTETKKQLGNYIAKVYAVSKECFFFYHRKYNCEILKLLRVTQYGFLRMITDTRNWNSHFLRNKKPDRLKRGNEIVIFFELVQYMIRLKIVKDIGADFKEENVKEYFYTIHDWILKVLYEKENDLKSKTYIASKQWDDFIEQVNRYIVDSRIVETTSINEA